jgi:hypothetical protein
MGNNYTFTWFKIAFCILLIVGVILVIPGMNPVLFPTIGEPTEYYDCDDGTLDMYHYFNNLGLETIPVVGNLELTGERFTQSDHVWLMVRSGDKLIAYDWGKPRFDKQHYEGYKISLDYLLYAVEQDKKDPTLLGIANKH